MTEPDNDISHDFNSGSGTASDAPIATGQLQPLAPPGVARPAARVPPRPPDPGPFARVRHGRERATRRGAGSPMPRSRRRKTASSIWSSAETARSTSATWLAPTKAEAGGVRWRRWPRHAGAEACVACPESRVMALAIVTAEERLAEANSKTTMAIFGPSGVGKTSLLWTLPPESDALRRPRGRHEVVQDWPGDSIPIRGLARCRRHRLPDRRRSTRRPTRAPSSPRATTSTSPRPTPTWSG